MHMVGETHVVFGTGPAGSTLAELLVRQGERVRCVNRSGKAALPAEIDVVAGDVLDALERTFGIKATPFDDAVRATIQWYRMHAVK